MQIKRLRISGFKSFVDPADLVIEPGLTGVVGPNGCGKSNLLEALRWTMGENSARSMRGAGMEDVIFAGTATRPPRDFAEVTILAEREARRPRSSAGSSAAQGPPTGSTGATCGPRTWPCSSLTLRPAPTPPRWSARTGSARSSPPSPPNVARCWRKRPDRRAPCPPPRCRDQAARDRDEPDPAGRGDRRPGRPHRHPTPTGTRGGALSPALRPDPRGRGADDLRPLARRGRGGRTGEDRGRGRRAPGGRNHRRRARSRRRASASGGTCRPDPRRLARRARCAKRGGPCPVAHPRPPLWAATADRGTGRRAYPHRRGSRA